MMKINQTIPDLELEIFQDGRIYKKPLKEFLNQWLILMFYPADFSFICPTELKEAAGKYSEVKKLSAEIISISTDSVLDHKKWHESSEVIRKITFPMAGDTKAEISKAFGVFLKKEGVAQRSTFIFNPLGKLKAFEVHDNSIGRSISEIIRKLTALKYAANASRD